MPPAARTLLLTVAAMLAFAGNSLLCRLALQPRAIDFASFTAVRLGAGAAMLVLLCRGGAAAARRAGSWRSALCLFGYAAAFSHAYLALDAGTGTLLLFSAVQATMIGWALRHGERPHWRAWVGFAAAAAGLLVLVLPGLGTPDAGGLLAMLAAGVAWGAYSLRGRGISDPGAATAGNFLRAAVPAALLLAAKGLQTGLRLQPAGVALAMASGAVTSGLGYVLWYAALRGLAASTAAMVQLSVPVLAAIGGVVLLGERPGLRLLLAAVLVLGGIAAALAAPRPGRRAA